MNEDDEYAFKLKAYKRIPVYVVLMGLCVWGLDEVGLHDAKIVTAGLIAVVMVYAVWRTITFNLYFNAYWTAKGLNKKAINAKRRETFPGYLR